MFSFLKPKIPPIRVFVRHCHYSAAGAHKARFSHFSREGCYDNLVDTLRDAKHVEVTFLLDTFHPHKEGEHFIKKQKQYPVIEMQAGTEAASFLYLLDYVEKQQFAPDTILYFLEDDYIHREGWVDILREGFTLPCADYVTLYDHKDKYFLPDYQHLQSQVFHTASCHWRTTPSTTNTYAMRMKTLLKHLPIHRAYSTGVSITEDHKKFCKLREEGATLISSIPGWSTHMEPAFASPCFKWEQYCKKW
ncbi:MAG: hypothetical protein JSS61_00995 [Verrucomicrobia bacterium]|nr:hypothetical protein [Verrucomicrobiota bacterium]